MKLPDEETEESLLHWLDSLLAPTFALIAVGEVIALVVSIACFIGWCICRHRLAVKRRLDRESYVPLHLARSPEAPQRPRRQRRRRRRD